MSEDVIKTLVELLEAQEEIKVEYEIRRCKNDKTVSPPTKSA